MTRIPGVIPEAIPESRRLWIQRRESDGAEPAILPANAPQPEEQTMHTPSDQSSPRPANPPTMSASRRRLLKAAARSAPLIATLPSGAALANASAFQCLTPLQEAATGGAPDGALPSPDGYLRVLAELVIFKNAVLNIETGRAYRIPFAGGTKLIDMNGNLFQIPRNSIEGSSSAVYLLVLYRSRNTDPVTVDQECDLRTVTGWTPTSPKNCVYPIAQVSTVQPGGNLGMVASCWCSLSPNDPLC